MNSLSCNESSPVPGTSVKVDKLVDLGVPCGFQLLFLPSIFDGLLQALSSWPPISLPTSRYIGETYFLFTYLWYIDLSRTGPVWAPLTAIRPRRETRFWPEFEPIEIWDRLDISTLAYIMSANRSLDSAHIWQLLHPRQSSTFLSNPSCSRYYFMVRRSHWGFVLL